MSGETEASAALVPGFRFHPTDEELVSYYLKRKVCGKPFRFDAISEIDIYKTEPWDLPGLSRLKSRDLEWYFFSALDRKYGSGSRTNRATERGYWKTTGKDRPVQRNLRTVGMKKTLVFHVGRAPCGERTNWVMHEYRLEDSELGEAGVPQDAFVVCRIFQKSGTGPKNGEQYGAPFVEEEWDNNVLIPQEESGGEDSSIGTGAQSVQPIDYEQNPEMGVIHYNAAPVMRFNSPDSNNSDDPVGFLEEEAQKFLDGIGENPNLAEMHDNRELSIGVGKHAILPEEHDEQDFLISMCDTINAPEVSWTCSQFNDENYLELKDIVNPVEADCPTGETVDDYLMYFDAPAANNQPPIEDGSFLEMNDLSNPVEADALGLEMLDDLLMYFDATEDNLHHEAFDSEKLDSTLDQSSLTVETVQPYPASQQASKESDMGVASSSKQKLEAGGGSRDENDNDVAIAPDVQNEGGWNKSLTKRFSSLLDSIPSPPAFAAEYPPKRSVKSIPQNSANNSSSIHVNAEAFFISELTVTGSTKHWSVQEGDVGFLLSYDMIRGEVMASEHLIGSSGGLESLAEIPSKATSAIFRSGFYLCFFWVLIFAVSFKIGSYIYMR